MARSITPSDAKSAPPQLLPKTFLDLPHELRQKIIFETYESMQCIANRSDTIYQSFFLKVLIETSSDEVSGPRLLASHITRHPVFRFVSEGFLHQVEEWTSTLKEVHKEISVDVDYVIGKVDWIQTLKEAIELASTVGW
ncbi:hypothetical protein FKW77_005107 [Venturia effusa]|uniref:Uncharacterized protein n=1 Tax=Venturia effusa TaxID=50376 RepID=A0A517LQ43_9PEZI|nr:hypothetical protein FKW77_005107 [Venturia effusa]